MKKIIYAFLLVLFAYNNAQAQTNVSGSLHSNTTWTAANSPYHITSDIYVFPGVTLSIEPGVKVVFDGNYTLEVRGNITAVGTSTAQIYFCGKMIVSGSDTFYTLWNEILIEQNNNGTGEFKYCVFKDANSAVYANGVKTKINYCLFENNTIGLNGYNIYNSNFETLSNCSFQYNTIGLSYSQNTIITNCVFNHNDQGMYACSQSKLKNCTFTYNRDGINIHNGDITSCNFLYNQCGIKAANFDGVLYNDTIKKCTIQYNTIGIDDSAYGAGNSYLVVNNDISYNTIGYKVNYAGDITGKNTGFVKNNKICSNTQYNIYNLNNLNKNFTDNCFCTEDSSIIEDKIYDGYDDPNLGLLTYNVYDSDCKHKLANTFKNLPVEDKDTGCITFGDCFNFSSLFSVTKQKIQISVYPNPTDNFINIQSDEILKAEVAIYDQYGKLVYHSNLDNSINAVLSIDVNAWSSGMYIINISSDGRAYHQTFSKI